MDYLPFVVRSVPTIVRPFVDSRGSETPNAERRTAPVIRG